MKRVRQNKILELIGEYDIDTQEELEIGRASCRERV